MTDLSTFTGTYTLDQAHTQIGFVARHAMVTRVRGTDRHLRSNASWRWKSTR